MTTTLPGVEIGKIKTFKQAANAVEKLVQTIYHLQDEINKLKKENARLKKQSSPPNFKNANKNKSSNYSVSKLLKDKFFKKKKWKKSSKKELIVIDQEIQLPEIEVCDCGCPDFTILRSRKKIVQGIVIKRNNVKYSGNDKKCTDCGKVHLLEIPESIKNKEFDSELASWVSYFKYQCRMSEGMIKDFLEGFDIRISTGQISKVILTNSNKLIPAYTHLRVWGIKLARHLHADATGIKRKLKLSNKVISQHLHFLGSKTLSIFKITRKYNQDKMAFKVLGKRAIRKVIVSDDHGANRIIAKMQLCWLHEIRHYLKLTPVIKSHAKLLERILEDWWQLYFLSKSYGRDPTNKKYLKIARKFQKLTNQETGYEQLDKRLKLTHEKAERMLLFLNYPGIPIENNLAERDLRPVVIIRKISGMLKSISGDRSLERHMSIIQTARKQELNVFETLHGLLNNQVSPFVLTAKA